MAKTAGQGGLLDEHGGVAEVEGRFYEDEVRVILPGQQGRKLGDGTNQGVPKPLDLAVVRESHAVREVPIQPDIFDQTVIGSEVGWGKGKTMCTEGIGNMPVKRALTYPLAARALQFGWPTGHVPGRYDVGVGVEQE